MDLKDIETISECLKNYRYRDSETHKIQDYEFLIESPTFISMILVFKQTIKNMSWFECVHLFFKSNGGDWKLLERLADEVSLRRIKKYRPEALQYDPLR